MGRGRHLWREIRKLSCKVDAVAVLFWFFFRSSVCLSVTLMATFRETRDLLAVAYFEDIIDEDEFILLFDLNSSKNLDFSYEDLTLRRWTIQSV